MRMARSRLSTPTKPRHLITPHRSCLGIDGSPASEAATALAFDEASRRGVELVALHAWSDVGVFPVLGMDWRQYEDEGHEVLGERLAGWQEQYPDVTVRRRIVCDQPARWLIDESEQAQLVVVGSRGRGGFPRQAVGFGQLRGGPSGEGSGDRRPSAVELEMSDTTRPVVVGVNGTMRRWRRRAGPPPWPTSSQRRCRSSTERPTPAIS